MTSEKNYFARPATENEIRAFKSALTKWGSAQPGNVEKKFGENIQVKSCRCCHVSNMQFDILVEERTRGEVVQTSSRGQTPNDPKVKFGVIDAWSLPTPSNLELSFKAETWGQGLPETEHFIACPSCHEKCTVNCDQCNSQRQIDCKDCKARGKFDCHGCNAFGKLNCGRCKGKGTLRYECPVPSCKDGDVPCEECGGMRYHYSLNGAPACRSCNASGTKRCPGCHGKGYEINDCNNCHGAREFECATCRGDKYLTCENCKGDRKVECYTCDRQRQMPCDDCDARGGRKRTEVINFKSSIHSNSYYLSPMENSRDKSVITEFGAGAVMAKTLTTEQIRGACSEPVLQPYALELMKEIQDKKPLSTLMERFQILNGTFMEMTFVYEGTECVAYLDFKNEDVTRAEQNQLGIRLKTNPLVEKTARVQKDLKSKAQSARDKRNAPALDKLSAEARELGFPLDADNFSNQAKEIRAEDKRAQEQKDLQDAMHFKRYIKNPSFFAVPLVIWAAVGFLTPLALHYLVTWLGAGYFMKKKSDKTALLPAAQKADWRKFMIIMGVIMAVTIAIGVGINYYDANSRYESLFEKGIGL